MLTLDSKNSKTGPIPVSRSDRSTCPLTCPLRGSGGCYGEGGRCSLQWAKVDSAAYASVCNYNEFCAQVAALDPDTCEIWRHNEVGDLPSEARHPHRIDRARALQLAQANGIGGSRGGFTYTHREVIAGGPVTEADARANRETIRAMLAAGFTVNLSADDLTEADRLADLGIAPVVVVLPADVTSPIRTPKGRTVAICPAALRDGITCASCKLCQRPQRRAIIGFPAHGIRARSLSDRLRG